MMHHILRRLSVAAGAGLLGLAVGPGAFAQSDFQQFYYNAGVGANFYYSPSSVQQTDGGVLVKWMDDHPKGAENLIFLAQIDCSAQTIRSLEVDRIDAATGDFIATVDLRANSQADSYSSGTMGGYLAAKVC